jgi:hypothetical protein
VYNFRVIYDTQLVQLLVCNTQSTVGSLIALEMKLRGLRVSDSVSALAKLRRATISFVISFLSVRPSVRMKLVGSHLPDLFKIDIQIFTVARCMLILSSLFYQTDAQLNIVFTLKFALKYTLKVLLHISV